MTYYNYFESCRKTKKDNPLLSTSNVVKIIVFLAVVFIVAWLTESYIIGRYERAIALIDKTQKDPVLEKQIQVSDQLDQKLEQVKKEVSFLDNVGKGMTNMNSVNYALFKNIHSCFTDQVFITSIEVAGLDVTIHGQCNDITQLSNAERAFWATGYFSLVHVGKIEGKDENRKITPNAGINEEMTFICNLTLKRRAIPNEQKE